MKNFILAFSIILLVAAGCNKIQQPENEQGTQSQANIPLQSRPNLGNPNAQQSTNTEAVKQDYIISDSQKTGWKTYANTTKKFSFDFPSDFKLKGGEGGTLPGENGEPEYALKTTLTKDDKAFFTVLLNFPGSGCGENSKWISNSTLRVGETKIAKAIYKNEPDTRCIQYTGFTNGIYVIGSMPIKNPEFENIYDEIISSFDVDNIFANLPKELRQKDYNFKLSPTKGYIITTSIASQDKSKIVYSEISDCIKAANSYNIAESDTCRDWKYNVFVKNLTTGVVKKVYSYPEPVSWYQNLLAKEAHAGGCPLVPFPLAWSKNVDKIVLELGNPTACGSGGYTRYWYFSISPNGGNMENLAYGDAIFLDSYDKVVYTDFNPNTGICGTMGESVGEGIILKDIESGKITKLVGEPGFTYSIVKINNQQNNLTYTVNKISPSKDGCFESTSPALTKTLSL
ncbi:MAG: hypothetical protein M1383_00145 [Patescibacteria group bacterium]|nr:hypothetical protein [Patescibacteria group bacterium]